jgi:hypothetical protein
MKQPIKPRKPIEPTKPTQTIKVEERIDLHTFAMKGSNSLPQILDFLTEKAKLEDFTLIKENYCYDDVIGYYFSYMKEVPNTCYEKELKRYQKLLPAYLQAMEKFEKDNAKYKDSIIIWEKWNTERQIREHTLAIKKLQQQKKEKSK